MTLQFKTLREANLARLPTFRNKKGELAHSQADGSDWNLDDWLVAVAGEVGELLNLLKKLRREDYTLDEIREEIGKEMADVVIYLDILAYRIVSDKLLLEGVDDFDELPCAFRDSSNPISWYGAQILMECGRIGTNHFQRLNCSNLVNHISWLAHELEINLGQAVISKFNEVSARVKSPIFIEAKGEWFIDLRDSHD